MKRKIALLLGAAMLLQISFFSVAEAETVADVYADMYGVVVSFNQIIEESAIDGYTLKCDNATVETTPTIAGNIVTLVPQADLQIDKVYSLNIAGQEKQFKIKKLFEEGFDLLTEGVFDETEKTNEYGKYKVTFDTADDYKKGEAVVKDGKLAFTHATFEITELNDAQGIENITLSADIEGYGKPWYRSVGKKGVQQGKTDNVAITANSDVMELTETEISLKPTSGDLLTGSINFGFSVTQDEDQYLDGTYTYETQSEIRNIGLRAALGKMSGYMDNTELLNVEGNISIPYLLNANYKTLAVIDNVLITYCTDDVAEPEEGEVKALDMIADINGLHVNFDRTLHGIKATAYSKIKVYKDNVLVEADMALDTLDEKILNIIPKGYSADATYKVDIEQSFGTKTMWTYQEYGFEQYLAPQEVKVLSSTLDLSGFTITLDTAIDDNNASNKIRVFENGSAINASIKVNDKVVTVVPDNLVIGNTYKVAIDVGLGSEFVYLITPYEYSQVLDKEALEVLNINSDGKVVSVVFSADISDVSNISSFVSVLKDDAAVPITCSVEENILNISVTDFQDNTIYELSVKKGIENEKAILKTAVLKKFELKQIAFEDFEDDEICSGITLGTKGQILSTGGENKSWAVWNDKLYITHPDAVASENVIINFDYKVYGSLNAGKKYNDIYAPYNYWAYNLSTTDTNPTGYRFYLNSNKATAQELTNGTAANMGEAQMYSSWEYADAYYDGDAAEKGENPYSFYTKGDIFPDAVAAAAQTATSSTRVDPPVYKVDFVKKGGSAYAARDGAVIMRSEPTQPIRATGYIYFMAQITDVVIFDNVRVRVFNIIEEEQEIVATPIIFDQMNIQDAATVSGSFKIKNYSGNNKPMCAIVAAYGENNSMLKAQVLDISNIEAGEILEPTFSLDGLSGTKKVGLFLFDTFNIMAQYGYYEFE